MTKKIVVTEPMGLSPEQKERLQSLGKVVFHDDVPSREDWLKRAGEADIVCSGKSGLNDRIGDKEGTEGVYALKKGTFVSHPYTNTAWMDRGKLKKAGITVSYAPGCNKDAVAEWVLFMALALFRKFPEALNRKKLEPRLQRTESLYGKNIVILGKGNVGTAVGERAEAFHMRVSYLRRGDDLAKTVKDAAIAVNCLSSLPANKGILDREFFFDSLPDDAYFISMTNPSLYDVEGMIEALEEGKLRGAGIDIGSSFPGNAEHPDYQKVLHPKILATPQIGHYADISAKISFDMMIENIAAFLGGKPIHLVK